MYNQKMELTGSMLILEVHTWLGIMAFESVNLATQEARSGGSHFEASLGKKSTKLLLDQ
jgi:hypothetical protein